MQNKLKHSLQLDICIKSLQSSCFHAEVQKGNTYPGEQGVKAMDLLPFSYISVILSHTLQRKLLHQVDLVGFLQVCVLQSKRRRELLYSSCATNYEEMKDLQ